VFFLLLIYVFTLNSFKNVEPKIYEAIVDYFYKIFLFDQQKISTLTMFAEYQN